MKIAVLGGGNGSFAAAGDFAFGGHDVRMWRRDSDAVAVHRAAGSRIVVKDHNGRHDVELALVTTDIAEAIQGVELILCPAPAFAQADIARLLAPHLRDGWYRTGDLGIRDADGYFWVHDRKKNLIISGGENIYPAEVERVLLEHPEVAECGVIGRSDPRWDEVPVAYVIRRAGSSVDGAGLKAHVETQLARFKVPRDIIFIDDLPRTALGKVRHFMLKQIDARTTFQGDNS